MSYLVAAKHGPDWPENTALSAVKYGCLQYLGNKNKIYEKITVFCIKGHKKIYIYSNTNIEIGKRLCYDVMGKYDVLIW